MAEFFSRKNKEERELSNQACDHGFQTVNFDLHATWRVRNFGKLTGMLVLSATVFQPDRPHGHRVHLYCRLKDHNVNLIRNNLACTKLRQPDLELCLARVKH